MYKNWNTVDQCHCYLPENVLNVNFYQDLLNEESTSGLVCQGSILCLNSPYSMNKSWLCRKEKEG